MEIPAQTTITLWNIRIDEPVTVLTDLILGVVCMYAFLQIGRIESKHRLKWYLKYYFFTLGSGAIFGGLLGHAFLYTIPASWKLISWVLVLISVACMIHGFLELARPLLKPGIFRLFHLASLFLLALAMFFTIWTLAFSPVKFYTITGLFGIVGTLSYYIYVKTGSRGVVRIMSAVGLAMVSAFVFSFEWGIGPWFNHNDISHLILTASTFIVYRGAVMIIGGPVSFPAGPSHI